MIPGVLADELRFVGIAMVTRVGWYPEDRVATDFDEEIDDGFSLIKKDAQTKRTFFFFSPCWDISG
jgi:hypothetical protein